MKSRLITFLLFVCTASLWASGAVPDSLLAERIIRAIYVNHPDSALSLLDEAEKRQASGIKPFRIDLLRAMCYEIKHDYPQKEQCVRRALQHDSICSLPERKLPLLVMLANILDRQTGMKSVSLSAMKPSTWHAAKQISRQKQICIP